MNWTLLVKGNTAVELACRAEQVHARFAIVALVRVIDLGLRQEKDLRAKCVPLDLCSISLVERRLTGRGTAERAEAVDFDARWSALDNR